jgi:hypothetical protein
MVLQGATTSPPPLQALAEYPCEGACPLGYAALCDGAGTVGEVEERFAELCHKVDVALGERGGVRWFLNHWDDTPRAEAVAGLWAEVERVLAERSASATPAA